MVIETAPTEAAANMAVDSQLLAELEFDPSPKLHLYEWEQSSLTYGYFIQPEKFIDLSFLQSSGVRWARRPTGGGIVFHQYDLAFSLLIPNSHPKISCCPLDNYLWINGIVSQLIYQFMDESNFPQLLAIEEQERNRDSKYFCMAKPTKYDVLIGGKKVGGAAQRRTRHGILHQGTICLMPPERQFLEKALLSKGVAEEMAMNSFPLAGKGALAGRAKERLRELLKNFFEDI